MATTSIWRVKSNLKHLLEYADNPEKTTTNLPMDLSSLISYATREDATNQQQLVTAVNCNAKSALEEMKQTKQRFGKNDGTIAYHGYQSFAPGEVTPQLAHEIGLKLANELWGDKYQAVVCTHVDKESHIHNHFVLNTVSFKDGMKYYRAISDYMKMREVSDRLCREYGLSVVAPTNNKGKHYSEWQADRDGTPTFRKQIRSDIDRVIKSSLNMSDFRKGLSEMGYDFKLYSKTGEPLLRPSLKPKGSERFFRFDRLGAGYDVYEIALRIKDNPMRTMPFPEEKYRKYLQYRWQNPPHKKLRGLAALYYHYCYELHILVKYPESVKEQSLFLREDLRELDRLDAQTVFLAKHKIETKEQLLAFRTGEEAKRKQLYSERKRLLNEVKQQPNAVGEDRLKQIAVELKQISKDFRLCNAVEKRSEETAATYQDIKQQQERMETEYGLLGGSGRPGREDDLERS